MKSARLAACVLGLAELCACSKRDSAASRAAKVDGATSSAQPLGAKSSSSSRPPPVRPACRALSVTGMARVDAQPIAVGELLDGEHWVTLETGARVSLRHTLTSREFELIGPARLLPCFHGAEQILLAQGQLATFAHLGVRPGAEVLIATAAGVIHYGDAAVDAEYGPKGLRLRVKEGEAWLEPEARGVPPFKNPLQKPSVVRLPPSPSTAEELTSSCEAAAKTAAGSAVSVLDPSPSSAISLGARAAAQVRDRGAARVSCAMAAAAVGALPDQNARPRLWASITRASELWQAVPRAKSAAKVPAPLTVSAARR